MNRMLALAADGLRMRPFRPTAVILAAAFPAAVFLAAAVLLVAPAPAAEPAAEPPSAPKGEHWPFVHPTFVAGGVLKPAEAAADPVFHAFRRGFEAEAGGGIPLQASRFLAAAPLLDRIWGYLDSEPTSAGTPGVLLALQFRRNTTLDQAAAVLGLSLGETTRLAGKEIRPVQPPPGWKGGPLAAHAVGPALVLLGSESVVVKELSVAADDGPLAEALAAARFDGVAGGVLLVRPFGTFWEEQRKRIPDQAAELAKTFLDLAPQTEQLSGGLDLRGGTLAYGRAAFRDASAADALRLELAGLWGAARLAPLPSAAQAEAKGVDQLVAAGKELRGTSPIRQSGAAVTVSIARPSNLAAAAEQAGRAVGKAKAKRR